MIRFTANDARINSAKTKADHDHAENQVREDTMEEIYSLIEHVSKTEPDVRSVKIPFNLTRKELELLKEDKFTITWTDEVYLLFSVKTAVISW